MEVKPLFSLLAAKAAIVNQLHGLSVCFASFNMVTPQWTWALWHAEQTQQEQEAQEQEEHRAVFYVDGQTPRRLQ